MSGRGVPIGVAIVGVLAFLAGLLWIVVGGAVLIDTGSDNNALIVGAVSVLFGLAFVIFGLGCLKGWGWVWTLGIVMSVLGIILAIYNIWKADFSNNELVSSGITILIELLIIGYLSTGKVKSWFGKS